MWWTGETPLGKAGPGMEGASSGRLQDHHSHSSGLWGPKPGVLRQDDYQNHLGIPYF